MRVWSRVYGNLWNGFWKLAEVAFTSRTRLYRLFNVFPVPYFFSLSTQRLSLCPTPHLSPVLTLRGVNCGQFSASLAFVLPRVSCLKLGWAKLTTCILSRQVTERARLSWEKLRSIQWHYSGYGVWNVLMVHNLLVPSEVEWVDNRL